VALPSGIDSFPTHQLGLTQSQPKLMRFEEAAFEENTVA
jgi:hypothetical protein